MSVCDAGDRQRACCSIWRGVWECVRRPETVREPVVASAAVCASVCDASDYRRVCLQVCAHMCVYVMAATVRSLWYHVQLSISVCDAFAIREFVVASAVVCATPAAIRRCVVASADMSEILW